MAELIFTEQPSWFPYLLRSQRGMSSLAHHISSCLWGGPGLLSLQGHLSLPDGEGELSLSLCNCAFPAAQHARPGPCSWCCGRDPSSLPTRTHSTFPWVTGNNGAGRTGQACSELQTLDKWVGRRRVTICRQVISFANGFSKGSKNTERGEEKVRGMENVSH